MTERQKRNFLNKIKKTNDCWLWTGYRLKTGYGRLTQGINKKVQTFSAHRIAYQLFIGEIGDKQVLHKCDNPSCVNPKHLKLGTIQDNIKDREVKGRGYIRSGENHPHAKLTEKDVIKIRSLYKDRVYNQTEMVNLFQVSHDIISLIVNRKRWVHIN